MEDYASSFLASASLVFGASLMFSWLTHLFGEPKGVGAARRIYNLPLLIGAIALAWLGIHLGVIMDSLIVGQSIVLSLIVIATLLRLTYERDYSVRAFFIGTLVKTIVALVIAFFSKDFVTDFAKQS